MLWGAILFSLLGVLIGLRYRAPALVPATAGALAWATFYGWQEGQSVGQILLSGIVLTFALHAAYLGGLVLSGRVGR